MIVLALVLVVVLSTPYRYPLATASDSKDPVCEDCSNGPDDRIKLRHPKSISSGQIVICKGGYWRTVCDDHGDYTFSETDADVACFQLGFTRGSGDTGAAAPGELGCLPPALSAYIAVNPKAPCKAWYEKLSRCIIGDVVGFCSPETAVRVTCEG